MSDFSSERSTVILPKGKLPQNGSGSTKLTGIVNGKVRSKSMT